MLIYCEKESPRAEYAIKLLFHHLYKCDFRITYNAVDFSSQDEIRISYSHQRFENALNIFPSGFLSGSDLKEIPDLITKVEGKISLFKTTGGDMTYDVLAAIFYMVSRYEEYLPFQSDQHDRFPLKESLAYKNAFHRIAIVHDWAEDVCRAIQSKFPRWNPIKNKYFFTPTFDIDNAYAYRFKSIARTTGGLAKALFTNQNEIKQRFYVLSGKEKDPYDNYDFIEEINRDFHTEPVIFHLMRSHGRYDRNIDSAHPSFQSIVKRLTKLGSTGLHPSYTSFENPNLVLKEKEDLTRIAGHEITKSRQHFLRFRLPETYRTLLNAGISKDYSMGFASDAGFRAGICIPYPFFDLMENRETDLMIYPFSAMESTFMYYRRISPEEAKSELSDIVREVRRVSGHFIPIWHNESLSDMGIWKGWRKVIQTMYKEAAI